MAIEYIKGDLFSDTSSILLHACNCKKTWGRGVAAIFAKRFSKAYAEHKLFEAKPGDVQVIHGDKQTIVCLFTSKGYGNDTDPPAKILKNTKTSLAHLGTYYQGVENINIASPKINAGLFKVKWGASEKLIEEFLNDNPNFNWKVYYVEDN